MHLDRCHSGARTRGLAVPQRYRVHRRYKHPTRTGTVIVPFHRRDMKRGTLLGIIKDAGLTTDEFIKLLRG